VCQVGYYQELVWSQLADFVFHFILKPFKQSAIYYTEQTHSHANTVHKPELPCKIWEMKYKIVFLANWALFVSVV